MAFVKPVNITFGTQFDSDPKTVLKDSEVTGYEAVNVQDPIVKNTWRSTTVGGAWVGFDFGTNVLPYMFFVAGHNLTPAATIEIESSLVPGWSTIEGNMSMDYDAKYLIEWGKDPDPIWIPARYWRIKFTDAANPDGYIEVGRVIMLLLGSFTEMSQNHKPDWMLLPIDLSEKETSEANIHYYNEKDQIDKLTGIGFGPIDVTARDEILTIIRALGVTGYVIVSLDPGSATDKNFLTLYGKIEDEAVGFQRLKTGVWEVSSFTIVEAL